MRKRRKDFRDRVGERSGRLTVIALGPKRTGAYYWLCRCECGTYIAVRAMHLDGVHTRSCGCLALDTELRGTHRMWTGHMLTYRSWQGMHNRCYVPTTDGYERYGGRGIKVCERWHDVRNFVADMGDRPPGMSIERKNSNGDYEPGNCIWASKTEQARNRSATRLTLDGALEILGRIEMGEPKKSIAPRLGVSLATVYDVYRGTSWRELDRPWLR